MEEYGRELEINERTKGKCQTFASKHRRNLNDYFAFASHPRVFKGEDSFLLIPFPELTKHRNVIVKCYNRVVFLFG